MVKVPGRVRRRGRIMRLVGTPPKPMSSIGATVLYTTFPVRHYLRVRSGMGKVPDMVR